MEHNADNVAEGPAHPPKDARRFIHRLRVRYPETDQMGVVYHANYLPWFEMARTEWIRSLGFPYSRMEAAGILLPVVDAEVHYHHPAFYDDLVDVEAVLDNLSPVRIEFSYSVMRPEDGKQLVTGKTRHVWVDRDCRPVRLNRVLPDLYAILKPFASGPESGG